FHAADFPYYTFGSLDRCGGIRHFVTSCRQGALGDVNLRSPNGVENRRRLAASVGFNINRLTTAEQTHSLNIAVVNRTNAGLGSLTIDSRILNADALITNQPGVCIMVLTADCQPVLLYDADNHAAAAIHAGWRGTAGGIVRLTVETMQREFGTEPSRLVAALGPCIGGCCFEVGDDVAEQFSQWPDCILRKPEWLRPHIELTAVNRQHLISAGLFPENIEAAHVCTKCQHDEFFSYRHNHTLGRIGTGVMVEKD
ncbi:MAG: peptidoglycan editing factor PgeF, partial [Salinivirgaceae bacterium]|nr:peptidoglycan editing factor PgeF [Salinivirgaceae bacterium]